MYAKDHGGDCCGASHLVDFGRAPDRYLLVTLDGVIDRAKERQAVVERRDGTEFRSGFSHLYEVVLNDQQMLVWAPELKKRGFTLGPRWFNSNSGNYCTMLFYNAHSGPRGRNRTKAPYTW